MKIEKKSEKNEISHEFISEIFTKNIPRTNMAKVKVPVNKSGPIPLISYKRNIYQPVKEVLQQRKIFNFIRDGKFDIACIRNV